MALRFVTDDIADHSPLDAMVYEACESNRKMEPPPLTMLLPIVVNTAPDKMDKERLNIEVLMQILEEYSRDPDADENSNLKKLLRSCWQRGSFEKIRRLEILRPPTAPVHEETEFEKSERLQILKRNSFLFTYCLLGLDAAYRTPYLGNTAIDFIRTLRDYDNRIRQGKLKIYARAISVVQSSGTGKSRLLTEVGKHIFTLPICLRSENDPGYPRPDEAVRRYFAGVTGENDMSYTAHIAITSFLAAAHKTMFEWLKNAQGERGLDGEQLLSWWHDRMERKLEPGVDPDHSREAFFSQVLGTADGMRSNLTSPGKSPLRTKENDGPGVSDIVTHSKSFYEKEAREAVDKLMNFLTNLHHSSASSPPICVTYFDEAQELNKQFWVLLRLVSHQPPTKEMWYVLMGTKSKITRFAPPSQDLHSLRLVDEVRTLIPPYFALSFDQNVRKGLKEVTATIGELQSLELLATYGRPLWKAQLHEGREDEMVESASLKLVNGQDFDDQNPDHVFAVLSQRLCIEPVVVESEVYGLADRSVANHMRLMTGISDDRRTFYTYSPSEPILVLAAVGLLYKANDAKLLGRVIDTFNKHLCRTGLVEKGLIGELGARVLLILARDIATREEPWRIPNVRRLVPLLKVIDVLFGNVTWTGSDANRKAYEEAFKTAHVNFTHWIVTKDALLPEKPDQRLLANLWARGAILQCCFNQVSIDFMMVVYHGAIKSDSVFDPAMLSAAFGQVKYKSAADTTAEDGIRPIGLPRDLTEPLPYLTLLFELGNDCNHNATESKIKVTIPEATEEVTFQGLTEKYLKAEEGLLLAQKQASKKSDLVKQANEVVKKARAAMDRYNRYSIAVRGSSSDVYGILREANVELEFASLLRTTMPSPTLQDDAIKHMRPLERLGEESGHNAWMSNYLARKSEDSMDVDS